MRTLPKLLSIRIGPNKDKDYSVRDGIKHCRDALRTFPEDFVGVEVRFMDLRDKNGRVVDSITKNDVEMTLDYLVGLEHKNLHLSRFMLDVIQKKHPRVKIKEPLEFLSEFTLLITHMSHGGESDYDGILEGFCEEYAHNLGKTRLASKKHYKQTLSQIFNGELVPTQLEKRVLVENLYWPGTLFPETAEYALENGIGIVADWSHIQLGCLYSKTDGPPADSFKRYVYPKDPKRPQEIIYKVNKLKRQAKPIKEWHISGVLKCTDEFQQSVWYECHHPLTRETMGSKLQLGLLQNLYKYATDAQFATIELRKSAGGLAEVQKTLDFLKQHIETA